MLFILQTGVNWLHWSALCWFSSWAAAGDWTVLHQSWVLLPWRLFILELSAVLSSTALQLIIISFHWKDLHRTRLCCSVWVWSRKIGKYFMFYLRKVGRGWAVVLLWLWYGFVTITEVELSSSSQSGYSRLIQTEVRLGLYLTCPAEIPFVPQARRVCQQRPHVSREATVDHDSWGYWSICWTPNIWAAWDQFVCSSKSSLVFFCLFLIGEKGKQNWNQIRCLLSRVNC